MAFVYGQSVRNGFGLIQVSVACPKKRRLAFKNGVVNQSASNGSGRICLKFFMAPKYTETVFVASFFAVRP